MTEVADKTSKTATEAAAAVNPAPARRAVVVDPQRMQTAEYVRRDWVCTAEEATTVNDILDPSYWCHVAGQLTAYDRIEVRIDTGEFLLELLVKQCGRNWAQVALLHHHDLVGKVQTGAAAGDEFDVLWKGPLLKWCVIRKSDKQALEQKMASKEAGLAWVTAYENTILAR